jgi:hypothetical protein
MRRAARGAIVLQLGVATILVLFSGCNRGPATVPVTGIVVFPDDSPLKGGMVEFRGSDVSSAYLARGVIGADGKFILRTGEKSSGAMPGDYHVVVTPEVPEDSAGMTPAQYHRAMHPIDSKYLNSSTSGLKFTVSNDPSKNDFKIVVQRPRQ